MHAWSPSVTIHYFPNWGHGNGAWGIFYNYNKLHDPSDACNWLKVKNQIHTSIVRWNNQ